VWRLNTSTLLKGQSTNQKERINKMSAAFEVVHKAPKGDEHKFRPDEVLFSTFTGRETRTPDAIQKMALGLLVNQIHNIGVRKYKGGVYDGKPICIFGHTRVLGGRLINQIISLLNDGKSDNEIVTEVSLISENIGLIESCRTFNTKAKGKPFILRATYFQVTDEEAVVMTMLENDDDTRTSVNAVDQAKSVRFMSDQFGWTDGVIAEKMKKLPSQISNLRRVLELDGATQRLISNGTLSFTHVMTLIKIDPSERAAIIENVKSNGNGKITASKLVAAARASGAKTSKPLGNTLSDFRKLCRQNAVVARDSSLKAVWEALGEGYFAGTETNETITNMVENLVG
jgi:hypothetical protein